MKLAFLNRIKFTQLTTEYFGVSMRDRDHKKEIILINVTGQDRPGLTSTLTCILAEYDVIILDIGQAVIHNYLSLGILIEIPLEHKSSSVLKDLLFAGHSLGLTIQFTPIAIDSYEQWVSEHDKENRIITLLGRHLTAEQISGVATAIADNGLNIDVITRLSGRASLKNPQIHPKACVQFKVSGYLENPAAYRGRLLQISKVKGIDIAFYVDDIYRLNRRLVVFVMDSTLIQAEVIDELAKAADAGEQVSEITEAAMRGEITFKESIIRRVAFLKDLDECVLSGIAENLPLTQGATRVTSTLKRLGYKIGIISGGFRYYGKYLMDKLGFDYVYANDLEIKEGKLTGRLVGDIILVIRMIFLVTSPNRSVCFLIS
jgi:phosphoserine phosphatase